MTTLGDRSGADRLAGRAYSGRARGEARAYGLRGAAAGYQPDCRRGSGWCRKDAWTSSKLLYRVPCSAWPRRHFGALPAYDDLKWTEAILTFGAILTPRFSGASHVTMSLMGRGCAANHYASYRSDLAWFLTLPASIGDADWGL